MIHKSLKLTILLAILISLFGCNAPTEQQIVDDRPSVGIANPASEFCIENGGVLEIRTESDGGQIGYCIFPDGSECEEWAFFREECRPAGQSIAPDLPPAPGYVNDAYGFSLDPPPNWEIAAYPDHILLQRNSQSGGYTLFIGFVRADEEIPPFRSGMPAGDWQPLGEIPFLGGAIPKQALVANGDILLVEYGANLEAGELRLFIWLEPDADNVNRTVPGEIISESDRIISSFSR